MTLINLTGEDDLCRNCGHHRDLHRSFGDEYDFDYYDCQLQGCSCHHFEEEDDNV